jgi:hypothetical protein
MAVFVASVALLEPARPVVQDAVVMDRVQYQSLSDDSISVVFCREFHTAGEHL